MGLNPEKHPPQGQPELDRLKQEYLEREQRKKIKDPYDYLNPAYRYMIHRRQAEMLRLVNKHLSVPLSQAKVLEVGCGAGSVLLEMVLFGANPQNLWGLDLLEWQLDKAMVRNPAINWIRADAQKMSFGDGVFDLILQFTAFTSILNDEVRDNMAREMLRVVKPKGAIVWYDFWLNPTNPQARGIRKNEIKRLFPGCDFCFRRVTLAPPVTKILAPISGVFCQVIESLRLCNSHYMVAIRPGLVASQNNG